MALSVMVAGHISGLLHRSWRNGLMMVNRKKWENRKTRGSFHVAAHSTSSLSAQGNGLLITVQGAAQVRLAVRCRSKCGRLYCLP